MVFSAVVAFALLIRWLALSRRQLARQEEVSELERTRRAILEEKAQIARDLHDVVAHHMSLVAVQAQSAPYRLTSVSDEVRAEFESIGATAREALNEIRGLLGVLRSDGVAPEHAPQPRAADLPSSSMPPGAPGRVSWEIDSDAARSATPPAWSPTGSCRNRCPTPASTPPEPPSPCRSAMRPARSCSGWPTGPAVTARPRPQRSTGPVTGSTGMRERVALLGGSLSAGPAPDGGFVVSAVLPLGETP